MARNLANGSPFVYTDMTEKASSTHAYTNGIVSQLSPPATRNASPTPARQARPHARARYEEWRKLKRLLEGEGGEEIVLDGESLDIPCLVAVAKFVFCRGFHVSNFIADHRQIWTKCEIGTQWKGGFED